MLASLGRYNAAEVSALGKGGSLTVVLLEPAAMPRGSPSWPAFGEAMWGAGHGGLTPCGETEDLWGADESRTRSGP